MASASGSMAAARGRKLVGESVWKLCRCSYVSVGAEATVGEEDDGTKCATRFARRDFAVDAIVDLEQ
jgi:hypothetical protein